MKFELEDMRRFAERHRGKHYTSGPHWSTLARFTLLFDECEKAIAHAESAEARVAELERVIRGMFPLWVAAIGYCEHGRQSDLTAMRNYYNGRDNPMTNEDIYLMFSLYQRKAASNVSQTYAMDERKASIGSRL